MCVHFQNVVLFRNARSFSKCEKFQKCERFREFFFLFPKNTIVNKHCKQKSVQSLQTALLMRLC